MEPLERIKFLRNWRKAFSELDLSEFKEVYVFGSVVTGKVTGGSDIDVILVISKEKDRTRALLDFLDEVERKLGEEKSYLFDVKVIYEDEKELPPFRSFLKDAVRIK